jgi:hypothetical protein
MGYPDTQVTITRAHESRSAVLGFQLADPSQRGTIDAARASSGLTPKVSQSPLNAVQQDARCGSSAPDA